LGKYELLTGKVKSPEKIKKYYYSGRRGKLEILAVIR
jgi:hypothetical protein